MKGVIQLFLLNYALSEDGLNSNVCFVKYKGTKNSKTERLSLFT